jgi:hypothetical protein
MRFSRYVCKIKWFDLREMLAFVSRSKYLIL